MTIRKSMLLCGCLVIVTEMLPMLGCSNTPINVARRPASLRDAPPPAGTSYEDNLTGGEIFAMYCQQCHNPRPIAERPLANFKNVAVHMRVRADLTGKEYAKLMEFFRRFHDMPEPTPADEPPPKRFIFNQPIPELQDRAPAAKEVPPVPTAIPEN